MGKITDPTSASYADLKEARADLARLRAENEALNLAFNKRGEVLVDLSDRANRAEAARDAAEAKAARMEEVLADIAVYGCGMLNQPAALNGPAEEWLRKRIARYEYVARAALEAKP